MLFGFICCMLLTKTAISFTKFTKPKFTRPFTQSKSILSMESKTFILTYEYVPNMLERRKPFRAEHLEVANNWVKEVGCKAGGPFSDGSGAIFIFEAPNKESVEELVKNDPYYQNGLIPNYHVKEWIVGIGKL